MFDFLKTPGKIEISTDKLSYSSGDTVTGKVKLEMSEPHDANGLKIRIWGEREMPHTTTSIDPQTHQKRTTTTMETDRIFEYSTDLDGQHMYSGIKEYPFELKIPQLNVQMGVDFGGGVVNQVAKAALAYSAVNQGTNIVAPSPIEWFIEADLDVPKKKDPYKKIQLNVG